MKCRYSDNKIKESVIESLSIAEVCRRLGLRPIGGNYNTLKNKFKELNIDTSHFTGKGWNVGLKFKPFKKFLLKDILNGDIQYVSSYGLKNKLLNEGIKEKKCENCNNHEWMGKPIKLELHHIDGDNTNNRLENLQILCPNCHSYTDTFRKGKSALSEKREVEYRKFKETLHSNVEGNLEPSLNIEEGAETLHDIPKFNKSKKYCQNCGNILTNRQSKYCSTECYRELEISKRPNVIELIEKFKELKSFVKVGEFYNVSDNAVRKWCRLFGILDMVKKKSRLQTF